METAREGNLQDFDVARFLAEAYWSGKAGVFRAVRGRAVRELYLDAGHLVHAASSEKDDRLEAVLLRHGRLRPEQIESAAAGLPAGADLGKRLVALGHLTEEEIAWAGERQMEGILAGLLRWREGTHRFFEGPVPDELRRHRVSTAQLLADILLRDRDAGASLRALGGDSTRPLFRDQDLLRYQELLFDEPADLTTTLLDGKRTILELSGVTPLDRQGLLRFLDVLRVLGLVELVQPGAPEPGPERVPPPAPEPEPSPAPSPGPAPEPEPVPQPERVPQPEPVPQPEREPIPEPVPEPVPEPMPPTVPEPMAGATAEEKRAHGGRGWVVVVVLAGAILAIVVLLASWISGRRERGVVLPAPSRSLAPAPSPSLAPAAGAEDAPGPAPLSPPAEALRRLPGYAEALGRFRGRELEEAAAEFRAVLLRADPSEWTVVLGKACDMAGVEAVVSGREEGLWLVDLGEEGGRCFLLGYGLFSDEKEAHSHAAASHAGRAEVRTVGEVLAGPAGGTGGGTP